MSIRVTEGLSVFAKYIDDREEDERAPTSG
jgi:hypothetical protein